MRSRVPAFLLGFVLGGLTLWAIQNSDALEDLQSQLAALSTPRAQQQQQRPIDAPSYQLGPENVVVRFIEREWDSDINMELGGFVSGTVRNPFNVGFDNVEIVVQSRFRDTITVNVGYVEPKGSADFRSDHGMFNRPRVIRVRGTPATSTRPR